MLNRIDGKSRLRLLLLSIFLGIFGADYFYVKKKKWALIKLAITLLGASIMVWTPTFIATHYAGEISASIQAQRAALNEIRTAIKDGVDASAIVVPQMWNMWDFPNLANAVTVTLIIGGVMIGISFGWSLFNVFQIKTGSFLDENNQRVSSWQSSELDVINKLLEERTA